MKKVIIAVACIVIAAGAVTGSYGIYNSHKNKKAVAEVASVSAMEQSYWEDSLQLDGYISEGNIQKITPDNQKLVEEVLVKKGDKVKKGDPILKYDQTALKLNLQKKENAVAMAEVNIQNAEKELAKYKRLKPSELAPTPSPDIYPDDEPDITQEETSETADNSPTTITDFTSAVSGTGSADDPYNFICNANTIVAADVLSQMKQNSLSACFTVRISSDKQAFQWIVTGANIPDDRIADWKPSDNVSYDAAGNISVDFSGNIIGIFKVLSSDAQSSINDNQDSEEADEMSLFGNNNAEVKTLTNFITPYSSANAVQLASTSSSSEDYMYSRAELAKMISDKQEEIKGLQVDKKSAELEYKTAKAQNDSGAIIATIDGIVSEINENHGEDEPFITIKSTDGLTVKGNIGELNLDKIQIGSTVQIQSWNTGETADATVTEIDTDPVSDYSQTGMDNPNSSTYQFTAQTAPDADIDVGSGISITIPSDTEDSGMYIPKAYVRDEDGKHYVMKDDGGKLKKQYIKTGKTVYGSLIEIKGGITSDDKICFPYGKNIKEGIKTKDTDQVYY